MKIFLLALLTSLSVSANDRNEDLKIKETGQFFVVNIIPGKKQTQFFIAGHKAAQLDINKLQVRGSYFVNGQERPFNLTRSKESFVTSEPLHGKEIQLEIKESPEKTDRLKIHLQEP